MDIFITKSKKSNKKFDAIIDDKKGNTKIISFGQSGYSDYTKHKDPERKERYIARHSKEDWSKSNIDSPAWMSRFILWEKPSLKGAIDNANKKYSDIRFKLIK